MGLCECEEYIDIMTPEQSVPEMKQASISCCTKVGFMLYCHGIWLVCLTHIFPMADVYLFLFIYFFAIFYFLFFLIVLFHLFINIILWVNQRGKQMG